MDAPPLEETPLTPSRSVTPPPPQVTAKVAAAEAARKLRERKPVALSAITGTVAVRCDVAAPAITGAKLLRNGKCDLSWATTLGCVMKPQTRDQVTAKVAAAEAARKLKKQQHSQPSTLSPRP